MRAEKQTMAKPWSDALLPDLLRALARCPRWNSVWVYDQCEAGYERLTSDTA